MLSLLGVYIENTCGDIMDLFRFSDDIQSAYEQLPHALAIYQLIDNRIFARVLSDGYCETFGFESREQAYKALEKDVFYNIHPQDVSLIETEAYRSLENRDTYDIIYRSRTAGMKIDAEFKVMHAIGKHVDLENGVHLIYIWYTEAGDQVTKKIMDLQESVTSLLSNMPAMTFSKDLTTRRYIACNQAFADYAHKETPEGVVGLTDFEIFDEATAQHFVDDDKKALLMNKPYIFYEDVPDAAGNPRRFQTTKLKFMDATGKTCLLGLCQDVTDAMVIKEEYNKKLENAQNRANIDALTGIRNKTAYVEFEAKLNKTINDKGWAQFAITIFDVNNLKTINDTLGHQAGDEYICEACKIICTKFKHSPVFRIGGDEFIAISQGADYENIDELLNYFAECNMEATKTGGIVIACGMARYNNEGNVSAVFKAADEKMYENKEYLKKLE